MFKTDDELKTSDGFVDHIVKRLKKQTRFSLDFNSIHKIYQEIIRIKKSKKKTTQDAFVGHLALVKENMTNKINYNIKTDVFGFLESVPFFSSELFRVNLEVLSRQKDLVYSSRQTERKEGTGE